MNPAAQEQLRSLRQRLADLEPYPWESVEEWVASARPLIKANYRDHLKQFKAITTEPIWDASIYGIPSRSSETIEDRFEENEAEDRRQNQKMARAAKKKILAFLDGLLALPSPRSEPQPSKSKSYHGGVPIQHYGDVIMGSKHSPTVTGSTVATLALGEAATANGTIQHGKLRPHDEEWGRAQDSPARCVARLLPDGTTEVQGEYEEVLEVARGLREVKPQRKPRQSNQRRQAHTNNVHHGDTHMGDKFTTNITGSTVGALAQGRGAVATGHVTIGATESLTQEQHKTAISAAQTALVHDQDVLEQIDDRLYEALGQFLTLARKIQVEQQSLAEVQAQMKATLDEVWAQQEAKGMKSQLLPKGLEVAASLLKSPTMAEVVKKLLGA